jgi:hypothetical protein
VSAFAPASAQGRKSIRWDKALGCQFKHVQVDAKTNSDALQSGARPVRSPAPPPALPS